MRLIHPFILVCSLLLLSSCNSEGEDSYEPIDWSKREISISLRGETHSSYLPIYSQIYSVAEHRRHNLTVTASIRNTDRTDTLYLKTVDLFDTDGSKVKSYVKNMVYVAPMETIEIVIDREDNSGGTGGNFIIDWYIDSTANEPYFEAVMISTSGSQGLSFTSQGIRIK